MRPGCRAHYLGGVAKALPEAAAAEFHERAALLEMR